MDNYKIICKTVEKIKALPPETIQSSPDSIFMTVWDEYKGKVQYEEIESIILIEDMMRAMVANIIDLEGDNDVDDLHHSIKRERFNQVKPSAKRIYLIESVLNQLKDIARCEEIEFKNNIDYIQISSKVNNDEDPIVVAKILQKISPLVYLVHAYSRNTGPGGEQGAFNLRILEVQYALKQISNKKFVEIKNSFNN